VEKATRNFPLGKFFFTYRSGLISGRISGLAGYRISGRISGKSYPVSGRIPEIKKWPDIRHIPSIHTPNHPSYYTSTYPNVLTLTHPQKTHKPTHLNTTHPHITPSPNPHKFTPTTLSAFEVTLPICDKLVHLKIQPFQRILSKF